MFDFLKKHPVDSTDTENMRACAENPEAAEEQEMTDRERNIQDVMKKTGWSRWRTILQMRIARKRLGISSRAYNRYNFYRIPMKDQKAAYQKILDEKQQKKEEKAQDREAAVEAVMQATGWNYTTTVAKIREARKRTGCTYKEYRMYQFYNLSKKVQNELFLIRLSKQIAAKYDVSAKFNTIFCNKELTNAYFSKYLRRPWCVNTKISFEEFREKFADSTRIIYKPLDGNRGRGVTGYDVNPDNIREVYDEVSSFPDGVVEQYVKQHPALTALAPASVNTLRVVTVSSNTEPVTADGKQMDIAYAALRIGGGHSVVDNFHSGGMVAVADLETGKLVTHAADMDGHVFETHPLTNTVIKGFQIPWFAEALQMVRDACAEHEIEGYLGWDIAIAEDGPMLIEINLRPGVVLLTTPYISEKKGMKHVMEKYL